MLVPVAAPMLGVVIVGELARTIAPEPVTEFPRAVTVPLVGSVNVVAPVTVNVVEKAPDSARVAPLGIVNVPVPDVIVRPFTLVAVATPSVGVVSVGLDARTILPVPVTVFPSAVNVPLVGSVRLVFPVAVSAIEYAPDVLNAPARLTVLPPIDPTVVAMEPEPEPVASPVSVIELDDWIPP